MKGTDVTQEEMDHVEAFMCAGPAKGGLPEQWIQTKGNFLRVMAWYGKIRAQGKPIGNGRFVVNGEDPQTAPPESEPNAGRDG